MAVIDITDPQVVAFTNSQARPAADKMTQAYWQMKKFVENYNTGNIGTLITNAGSANLVADGSKTDGRTPITGGDIFNLITAAQAYIAFVEGQAVATAARLDVISKPHVND